MIDEAFLPPVQNEGLEFHIFENANVIPDYEIDMRTNSVQSTNDVSSTSNQVASNQPSNLNVQNLNDQEKASTYELLRKHRYQTKFNEVASVMASSPERHLLAQSLLTVLFSRLELSSSSYDVKSFLPLDIGRMSLLKELCFQKFTSNPGDI